MWKSDRDHASYLQKVCYINHKYNFENVFPNQYKKCSEKCRELMGITDIDQIYS